MMRGKSLLSILISLTVSPLFGQTPCPPERIWTTSAHFLEGVRSSRLKQPGDHNDDHHSLDRLELLPPPGRWGIDTNQGPAIFPYINVATPGTQANPRGTIARVEVNTGAIVGEYRTAPRMPQNPSRTTVDTAGNCYVANRNENSVTCIALLIGGTRGTKNVNGESHPSS